MLYLNDYRMQSPLFNLIYLFDDEHPLPKHTRAIPDVLGRKNQLFGKLQDKESE